MKSFPGGGEVDGRIGLDAELPLTCGLGAAPDLGDGDDPDRERLLEAFLDR